jgi:hypothetical protein
MTQMLPSGVMANDSESVPAAAKEGLVNKWRQAPRNLYSISDCHTFVKIAIYPQKKIDDSRCVV